MKMLEWEIEPWQFGWDKEVTISLPKMMKLKTLMLKRQFLMMILMVFGLMFTLVTVERQIRQLVSLNSELKTQ